MNNVPTEGSFALIKSYVDGVLNGTAIFSSSYMPIVQNDFDLIIGGQVGWVPRRFIGSMDELRIWSVAKSDDDIFASFAAPLDGSEAGLELYINFEGDAATSVTDKAHGTETGVFGTLDITTDHANTLFGSSATFSGDDYLVVTDIGSSPLDLSSAFTLEAWIKSSSLSQQFASIMAKVYSHSSENWSYGIIKYGDSNELFLPTWVQGGSEML